MRYWDNALPGSCDINLPSNAGTLFNSLSAWSFALSRINPGSPKTPRALALAVYYSDKSR